jgi:hypothetical protein
MAAPSTVPTAFASTAFETDVWGVHRVVARTFTVGAKYYDGIAFNPQWLGLSTIQFAWIVPEDPTTAAYVYVYNHTDDTIRVYNQTDSDNGVALGEVADSDTAFTPHTVRILAIGV